MCETGNAEKIARSKACPREGLHRLASAFDSQSRRDSGPGWRQELGNSALDFEMGVGRSRRSPTSRRMGLLHHELARLQMAIAGGTKQLAAASTFKEEVDKVGGHAATVLHKQWHGAMDRGGGEQDTVGGAQSAAFVWEATGAKERPR